MFRFRFLFASFLFLVFPAAAHASMTSHAQELTQVFDFTVTNSILTSWVVSLLIILAIRFSIKTPQAQPNKAQAFFEIIVENIIETIEPIVGKQMVRPTFWLLSGLFFFIVVNNWSGLIPSVGTLGWGHAVDGHFHLDTPLIRPANADLNMTLALAAVSIASWCYYIMRYAGLKVIIKDIFGNKSDKGEIAMPVYYILSIIFVFVGFIEIISMFLRPVTLSFRLFGNVFGGENLLHGIMAILPGILKGVMVVPFYFMELLVGFVQGLVFTLLVAVYIGLICNHDSEEHH